MVTRNVIDKDFRILNKSCNSFTLPQVSDNDVEALYLKKGSQSLQKSTHESIDNLETTHWASLQGTPNLPNSIAKLNAMAINWIDDYKIVFYGWSLGSLGWSLEMKFHY